ncbi:hypothetical protein SK224_16705, partial [Microbacterium sp. BG28]|uniref:hypothetical protein n=1 Tax=Microbacterium sp. BG28 TaxID=3097356 RepID=UPI002A5A033E
MAETTFEFIDGVTPDASLPVLAPSAGVPGYAARWIAADIDGADGTAVTSWRDIVNGRLLNVLTGSPTLRVASG